MRELHIRSASEQMADFLREEIQCRRWSGTLPGEQWLVTKLGAGRNTVRAALDHLEAEGVLLPQGHGRRRKIAEGQSLSRRVFRVALLLYSPQDRQDSDVHDIQYHLSERGHEVKVAPKSLTDLGMKVERVAKMVKQVEADAWVVFAASHEVLDWFAGYSVPAIAMFGRFSQHPMAGIGPDKFPAYQAAVRRLVELGHRRIVLLQPEIARKPQPARLTQRILDEMESHGIRVGSYNLPDWECNPAGLRQCLDVLFGLTPPTALFIEEAHEFFAVRHHLAERGIFAPNDISLICSDDHPAFKWCEPPVSCIRWSSRPLVRRIIRWVDNIASGKDDRRRSFSKVNFVEGGTIGPVPKAKG
jgi:DNA-binding LacI/PurR family transcriptional regulator